MDWHALLQGYYNIAYKSLEILIQGATKAPYVMKLDDDTYLQA